ncbi:MAG: transcriptional regulator [Rhodocyclales bacterium]|nr:transcriptional regulator [Rhodocyclales bacterium]
MPPLNLHKSDLVDDLKTAEDIVAHLKACMAEAGDDAASLTAPPLDMAQSKGMPLFARDTDLGRGSLYKDLSGEGNPTFADGQTRAGCP